MLEIIYTTKFKKEYKIVKKRRKNLEKLSYIIEKLRVLEKLPDKNRDHNLTGNYIGCRECHIEPDWLLIYSIDLENNKLRLFRTGSHSDLFD